MGVQKFETPSPTAFLHRPQRLLRADIVNRISGIDGHLVDKLSFIQAYPQESVLFEESEDQLIDAPESVTIHVSGYLMPH